MANWPFENLVRRALFFAVFCSVAAVSFYLRAQQIPPVHGKEVGRFLAYSSVGVFGVTAAWWWIRFVAATVAALRQR